MQETWYFEFDCRFSVAAVDASFDADALAKEIMGNPGQYFDCPWPPAISNLKIEQTPGGIEITLKATIDLTDDADYWSDGGTLDNMDMLLGDLPGELKLRIFDMEKTPDSVEISRSYRGKLRN